MSDYANQRKVIKASPQRCFDMVSEPSTPGAFMMRENKNKINEVFTKADRVNRLLNEILEELNLSRILMSLHHFLLLSIAF